LIVDVGISFVIVTLEINDFKPGFNELDPMPCLWFASDLIDEESIEKSKYL